MIILGIDPGGTCGWVVYDSISRAVRTAGACPVGELKAQVCLFGAVILEGDDAHVRESLATLRPGGPMQPPVAAVYEAVAEPGQHCALYGRRTITPELLATIRAEGVCEQDLGALPWGKARIRRSFGQPAQCGDSQVKAVLQNAHGGASAVGDDPCPTCHGRGGSGRGKARMTCPACQGSRRTPRGPLWPLKGQPIHCWHALAAAYARAQEVRDE